MSGGRVHAIADCMDRPRLYERHLVHVMTLARTGLFFEGFCGSAMRFCITSRQRGSTVPARITSHPEVVRVVGHSVAVKSLGLIGSAPAREDSGVRDGTAPEHFG